MNTEKRFTLSFPDGSSVLTCDLRGATFLPAGIVPEARLDSLEVGQDVDVFLHNQLFVWERIA